MGITISLAQSAHIHSLSTTSPLMAALVTVNTPTFFLHLSHIAILTPVFTLLSPVHPQRI
jgi:hypothetical protein